MAVSVHLLFVLLAVNLDLGVSADLPLRTSGDQERHLKLAAWNIQTFGKTKYNDQDEIPHIKEVIAEYDIICIQEIRWTNQTLIPTLVSAVNTDNGVTYFDHILGPRLGPSSYKEQYACIYNSDIVTFHGFYTFDDEAYTNFDRPPLIANVSSTISELDRFILIVVHTKPDTTKTDEEIDHLVEVYDNATDYYDTDDAVIFGDFNADCTYVVASNWPNIELFTDTRFTWYIGHHEDTTVTSTDCAYDRIVGAGSGISENVVPGSAGIFDYMTEYGLTQSEAQAVSDHWPVEFCMYGKVDAAVLANRPEVSVTVQSPKEADADPDSLVTTYDANNGVALAGGFAVSSIATNTLGTTDDTVKLESTVDCDQVVSNLNTFKASYPDFMTATVVALVDTMINHGGLPARSPDFPETYEDPNPSHKCRVQIYYNEDTTRHYHVVITKFRV